MIDQPEQPRVAPVRKFGKITVRSGSPLEYGEDVALERVEPVSARAAEVLDTFRAYRNAAKDLLATKYANHRELAPAHMRESCNILIIDCADGMLIRYDVTSDVQPKVRYAIDAKSIAEVSPLLSEGVIHFPDDPATYEPTIDGPRLALAIRNATGEVEQTVLEVRPIIYATTKLPDDFRMPPVGSRPPALAALTSEIDIQLHGVAVPNDSSDRAIAKTPEQFIVHSRFKLKVGWETFEIYPSIPDGYWKSEYARAWAELDLLAVLAQRNAISAELNRLDGRAATRNYYASLLSQFEQLLLGPEEPVHQFLKAHPELLCPTSEQAWSKLPFGERVSDFVFREPFNDYQLVEIEAPIRELFRKDGQQREELTHAINQILDWLQYIGNNREKVETELGLTGISPNPRTLIVIGRSNSLTHQNREKLATIQAQHNKLRILTYDDLIASARANLENMLGPLSLVTQNAEVYYFRN